MKHFVMEVNGPQSFVRFTGPFKTKPNVTLPFDVPLDPGGYLELAIDETTHTVFGHATNLKFTTDKLLKNTGDYITGVMQQISVRYGNLTLDYDPATGEIRDGGCYLYVHGEPSAGGLGSLGAACLPPSKLIDSTGPAFDLTDGLGCGGGCVVQVGSGNPIDFIVHLNTAVLMQDLDGDGNYERWCPSIWKKTQLKIYGPKIEVIWPRPIPSVSGLPGTRFVHHMRLRTLLEMARQGGAELPSGRRLTQLHVHNASHLGVLLYDESGHVKQGDMSDNEDKMLRLSAGDLSKLTLGVVVTQAE